MGISHHECLHQHTFELKPILEQLGLNGWVCQDNFLEEDVIDSLLSYLDILLSNELMQPAAIGHGQRLKLHKSIRLSHTCWIDDWSFSEGLVYTRLLLEKLQNSLNQYFFLSLKRFESQLASYPIGGYYKKHLDQIKGRGHRQVSLIIYLNDCDSGGELVLFDKDDKTKKVIEIKPKKGRCVIFFSSQVYHEVLPTHYSRFSFTTWFRDDLWEI